MNRLSQQCRVPVPVAFSGLEPCFRVFVGVAPFHVLYIPVFRRSRDMPYCPSPMFWVAIFSVLESSQPWVSAWPSQKPSVLFLLCHMAITSIQLLFLGLGSIKKEPIFHPRKSARSTNTYFELGRLICAYFLMAIAECSPFRAPAME